MTTMHSASLDGRFDVLAAACPTRQVINRIGDRWSLLVLRDIVFGDRRYFRELQAGLIEGIASNILADRLKRLVEVGLLTREDT